jgi:hypothetical protein
MAAGTALFGTALVFCGAYLLEKTRMPVPAARHRAAAGDAADGGAGPGAGPGLHLLLQRAGNPLNGCTTRSRC